MPNLNKVFLMGHLTRDPELRYAPSGTAIASFGVANNRTWTDGNSGEKKEEACFVDITMFGKRAEVINEYFSKGSAIFIQGRLQLNQWETKEGQKRSMLRVVAEDFQFVGGQEKREAVKPEQSSFGKASSLDIPDGEIPF